MVVQANHNFITTTTNNSCNNNTNNSSSSSLKTIYLRGKAPWGFRIIEINRSPSPPPKMLSSQSNQLTTIVVSKIRNNSKADLAGLRENDRILYINDVPTSHLTLEEASDLIDDAETLCLIVSSSNSVNGSITASNETKTRSPNSVAFVTGAESLDAESDLLDELRGEEIATATASITNKNNQGENIRDSTTATTTTTTATASLLSMSRRTSSTGASSSSMGCLSTTPTGATATLAPSVLSNPAYTRFLLLATTASTENNNNSSNDNINSTSTGAHHNASRPNHSTNTNNTYNNHNNYYYNYYNNHNHHQAPRTPQTYINLISSHRRNLRTGCGASAHKTPAYPSHYYYSSANESNDESDYSLSVNTGNNNNNYFQSRRYVSNNPNKNRSALLSTNYSNSSNNNSSNNRDKDTEDRRVSYASITLKPPVKDLNYFSDTEALNGGGAYRRAGAATKPFSVRYKKSFFSNNNKSEARTNPIATFSNSSSNSNTKSSSSTSSSNKNNNHERSILSNNHNLVSKYDNIKNNTNNKDTTPNSYLDYFSNIFLNNNHNHHNNYNPNYINKNNYEQMNQSSSSNSSSNSYLAAANSNSNHYYNNHHHHHPTTEPNNMFSLSTATDFNRKPHGFSKLSPFGGGSSATGGGASVSPPNVGPTTSQFTSTSMLPVQFSVQPRAQSNQYAMTSNQVPRVYQAPISSSSSQYQQPQQQHQQHQQQYHQQHQQNQHQQESQYHQQYHPNSSQFHSHSQPNMWSSPQSSTTTTTVRMPTATLDDDIEVVEKYEREMGSELAKPSPNKPNYSDSYFYNSPIFKYPTINEQKKLAKSIADTLESSNPNSKYHKKKQIIQKQMAAKEAAQAAAAGSGYESETPQSPGIGANHRSNYYSNSNQRGGTANDSPTNDYSSSSYNAYNDPMRMIALDDDSTLPDVIKRSIAKAAMTDPVRMVQAPENFRAQHYTEHVTHTEMPPKAAMSLAHALETAEPHTGGRGAAIFQRRKAKSEKWVVDETNVKRPPGYSYTPPQPAQPQPQQQQPPQPTVYQPPKPIYIEPHPEPPRHDNINFGDFNAKPKGWSQPNNMVYEPPKPARMEEPPRPPMPPPPPPPSAPMHQMYAPPSPAGNKINTLNYNPNKIDLTNWQLQQQRQMQQQQQQQYLVSKDGVESLKARFYDAVKSSEPMPHPQISRVKLNKLSSHENYLFNSRNALNALKNSTNQYFQNQNQNQHYYDDNFVASDL